MQTGDALRSRLNLESDDLAVLIGSQSVRDLHELRSSAVRSEDQNSVRDLTAEQAGSESAEAMFAEHQYVRYDGSLDDGRLSSWLKLSPTLHQLLSAPILVSTIDHLMPATEGERGGRQIAPMLRLLTSDLVLDEPDDFDLADLPALARLVNWAGMLGSRVLLSSATLPPALITALFDAYLAGRSKFNAVRGHHGTSRNVCCAWFDEFRVFQDDYADLPSFAAAHGQFVQKRIASLEKLTPLRRAELIVVKADSSNESDVITAMASTISEAVYSLHGKHHQPHPSNGKRVSVGLVRLANIDPLVAIAQQILCQQASPGYCIHFCIYHSRHPLLVRSEMERELDAVLARHRPESLWQHACIQSAMENYPQQDHIFIVFGTAVTEVGRDHDYDWAIAEPSSMRSLIQLAGRLQRHREQISATPNLHILNKNRKALKGLKTAYSLPGFEAELFSLKNKDLQVSLLPGQYRHISAIPRIQPKTPLDSSGNLVDLEHAHLQAKMFGTPGMVRSAALWWRHNVTWSGELQRRDPFRNADGGDELFVLYMDDDLDEPLFHHMSDNGEVALVDDYRFERPTFLPGNGMQPWLENDAKALIERFANIKEMELAEISKKYTELRLRKTDKKWLYHPWFGVYGAAG